MGQRRGQRREVGGTGKREEEEEGERSRAEEKGQAQGSAALPNIKT